MTIAKHLFLLVVLLSVSIIFHISIIQFNSKTNSIIGFDETPTHEHRQLLDFLRSQSAINQTNVSLTIAKYLFTKESHKEKNIVLSPLSIQVVLSVIAAGSEGATQQQLLDFLGYKSIDQLNFFVSQLVSIILSDAAPFGGPRLSVANSVWVEQTLPLQPFFKETVSTHYKATLSSVDFKNKVCIVYLPFFTLFYHPTV